jgi:Leucine-rich repeat (LRR) protein
VHLRHLDLTEGRWWVYDLAALGGLRQLTYLNLSGALAPQGDEMEAGLLPALGVLPVLQQLNLQFNHIDSHQWPAVGAWLGQQPQLTRLSLQHTKRHQWEVDPQQQALGLAQLPTQLVELDLTYCNLQQLPRRLSQLTRLRVLLVGEGNPDLPPRLPAWLPALRALETLQVQAVKGPEAVELLAQLPRLQRFGAFSEGNRYAGLAGGWEKRLAVRLPHVNLQLGRDYTVCFFPCHFEEWHSCYDMD